MLTLGVNFTMYVALVAAMTTIELAYNKGWFQLWLKCDSSLVVSTFKSCKLVSWKLRVRWENCLVLLKSIKFEISHIYREGNKCVNGLANYGATNHGVTWWDTSPSFIREYCYIEKLSLPNYRFS